jgi:hypothetical protein
MYEQKEKIPKKNIKKKNKKKISAEVDGTGSE